MAEDEADVIARARRGDRRAFNELVRTYQRRVYATALHITGNHGDADDVTQETFVRAYRGLSSFDGRSDLFTWLYRVTVNTALNLLRSGRRTQNLAAAGAIEVAAGGGRPERLGEAPATPAQLSQIEDRLRRVLDEVCALSPTLRITLVLATVEQLPYRKIAEILEIPEGTVAWRVNEARRKLRESLALDDPDDDVEP
jgi:RNA polymerase sigma-70 factor, ECF subfamily